MRMRLHRSLKLQDVAEFLALPKDRATMNKLRREIRTREEMLGEVIMRPGRRRNSPHTTTIPILRESFPEWFDSRAEMEDMLRSYIGDIERQIEELRGRDETLAKKLRTLGIQPPIHSAA